jgi:hypothetical protein
MAKKTAQQCVQADLVVRAALEPPSRRKPFSVSLAGPPAKPLTLSVGRLIAVVFTCLLKRMFYEIMEM